MSSTPAPHVAIVILTWNGREDVLRCLSTLPRIRYPNWDATVVDNASTDGTVEAIREAYPAQRILVMSKNLGFCGGNNRGIADALTRGADYVLLLNNDTELHPDLLDELVQTAQSAPGIGAVGSKNILMEDHGRIWGAYGEIRYHWKLVELIGYRQPDGPEYSCVKDVDWVIGNGLLLSRPAIDKVGGFDEFFFGYHEDVDWCERARKAGFRTVFDGRAIIYHKGFGASGSEAIARFPVLYFLGRNSLLFARKHASLGQLCKFVAAFFVWFSRQVIGGLRHRNRLEVFIGLWMLRGFVDGLLGRLPLRDLKLQ